jgi:hypothetical protein
MAQPFFHDGQDIFLPTTLSMDYSRWGKSALCQARSE